MRFSVGVNYWPRSEMREDFARIAELGLDTVRFFVKWDDGERALEQLESVVSDASAAGLQTIPALSSAPGSGNIYRGALLETQMTFAQAAGERLRAHSAIRAWDIGHAFTTASPPASGKVTSGEHASEPVAERAVAAWSKRLAGTFKTASSLPATAGTTSDDITHETNIRLASLCAPLAFASMQGSNVSLAFARDPLDLETLPFLALLTAAFSFKPVMITGFGNPAQPYVSEDDNATYCAAVLERLHADGRLGAYWWSWAGMEPPVAAALAAFARQGREVVKPRDMPMISSTYYYRTLPLSTQTLFDAFLGFVEERRRTLA
jgi:hypothetical protein